LGMRTASICQIGWHEIPILPARTDFGVGLSDRRP
jgi:hypothetical protein